MTRRRARDPGGRALDEPAALGIASREDQSLFRRFGDEPHGRHFTSLPLDRQRDYFDLWRRSRFLLRREFYATARSLVMISAYSMPETWAASATTGPLLPARRRGVPMTRLDCDVLVIGSGAAGGVLAATLGELTGKRIVLLEKGGHYTSDFFNQREWDMHGPLRRAAAPAPRSTATCRQGRRMRRRRNDGELRAGDGSRRGRVERVAPVSAD